MATIQIDFSTIGKEKAETAFNQLIQKGTALERINQRIGQTSNATTQRLVAGSRQYEAALLRQMRAVNGVSQQLLRLSREAAKSGNTQVLTPLTAQFNRYQNAMSQGALKTRDFQRVQLSMNNAVFNTKRQLTDSTKIGGRYADTLSDIGSAAVLAAGPLSGIGSRIIALAAIAKRGSIAWALMFGAIALVGHALAVALGSSVDYEASLFKIEAVLRRVGRAHEFTTKEINAFAIKLGYDTLTSAKAVREASVQLLTYTNITKRQFFEILTLSQDLASAGFGTLEENANRLGRAFNDPVQGLELLKRAGLVVDSQLKNTISGLHELGRDAEAAGILISKFQDRVEGLGKSETGGAKGAVDSLKEAFEELKIAVSSGGILSVFTNIVNGLSFAIQKLTQSVKFFSEAIRVLQEVKPPGTNILLDNGPADIIALRPPKKSIGSRRGLGEDLNQEIDQAIKANKTALMGIGTEANSFNNTFDIQPEVLDRIGRLKAGLHNFIDDSDVNNIKLTNKGFDDLNNSLTKVNARKQAFEIFKNTRTPIEEYALEIAKLNKLHNDGSISAELYQRGLSNIRKRAQDANPAIVGLRDGFDNLGVTIVDALRKGENAFKSFLDVVSNVATQVQGAIMQMAVINPIINELFGLKGSDAKPTIGNTGGGLMGKVGDFIMGLFGKDTTDQGNAAPMPGKGGGAGVMSKGECDCTKGIFAKISDGVSNVFQGIGSFFSNIFQNVGGWLGNIFANIGNAMSGIFNAIQSGFNYIFSLFSGGGGGGGGLSIGGLLQSFIGGAIGGGGFGSVFGSGGVTAPIAPVSGPIPLMPVSGIDISPSYNAGAFAHGGSFTVPGSGSTDSAMVRFRATPGEHVNVSPSANGRSGGGDIIIHAPGADKAALMALRSAVRDLQKHGTERSAASASELASRNPRLFSKR
jgi:hypothetical protein